MDPFRIFLGWDPREQDAYRVACASIDRTTPRARVQPISIQHLPGLYTRPTEHRSNGLLWDVISEAPMSTIHAVARFFVPIIVGNPTGWALFSDGDILVRRDLTELFALADERYAVMVVQHDYTPTSTTKMDGQVQTAYARKLWSSVILWNLGHFAHMELGPLLNTVPGRDLHRFCWLKDEEIGALPSEWNHLVGISPPRPDAGLVHFTLGLPSMAGYADCEYAEEWRTYDREGP